jgi:septum formation protein
MTVNEVGKQAATVLILGSGSPRRHELLTLCGAGFTVRKPDIDETPYPGENAAAYVRRLCQEKAMAITAPAEPAIIITADTTVALDGEILGKPANTEQALAMLRRMRARSHMVHTGVAIRTTPDEVVQVQVVDTVVHMRDYSELEMAAYVASGDPFDKAGSYAIQDTKLNPVVSLDGCFTNVMGLPMCVLALMLAKTGIFIKQPYCDGGHLPCQFDRR